MILGKNLWRGSSLPLGCEATAKIASATHSSGTVRRFDKPLATKVCFSHLLW